MTIIFLDYIFQSSSLLKYIFIKQKIIIHIHSERYKWSYSLAEKWQKTATKGLKYNAYYLQSFTSRISKKCTVRKDWKNLVKLLSSIQYGQSFLVIDKPPLHKRPFTADACITFENSSQVLNYMSGRPFCKCFAQLHTSRFFRKTKFHSVAFLKCHLYNVKGSL